MKKTLATQKAEFCASFPWTDPFPWTGSIRWLDTTGLVELPKGRIARIDLWPLHSYNAFRVSIISNISGHIDSKEFTFEDYLDVNKRKDNRSDYKDSFHASASGGLHWYIAVPADTTPIVSAIEQYIAAFVLWY